MADWYASSANYTATPVWAASTAYTVGQFVRALTAPPQIYQYFIFRCTTAGTSAGTEPNFASASNNNQTIASGTATFTNVTGQSAYGWTAAGGTIQTMSNASGGRPQAGDRLFVASDHTETNTGATYTMASPANLEVHIISVNRAGSVPPVSADLQSGASISTSGGLTLELGAPSFWHGISFTQTGSGNTTFQLGSSYQKPIYFKNCTITLNSGSGSRILQQSWSLRTTFDNTAIVFGHAGQYIANNSATATDEIVWINTPSAIQGVSPSNLFPLGNNTGFTFTARGCDFSGMTGNLLLLNSNNLAIKFLFESCRVSATMTRFYTTWPGGNFDEVEYINCHDGANPINERYEVVGAVTTDRTTTMSGGAVDGTGAYSFKMVSAANCSRQGAYLRCFWFDIENATISVARTVTVEIISSATLNNDDVHLMVEYLATAGTTRTSFTNSMVLLTSTALPTSSATWANPPGTPIKQYLQTSFTPLVAGRVRVRVGLGKPSATIWVNPQVALA